MKLQNKIISGLSAKVRGREELLRMEARDKVRTFHKLYPQVKGKKREVKLLDKDAASYLDMTEFTFSRLAAEMEGVRNGGSSVIERKVFDYVHF